MMFNTAFIDSINERFAIQYYTSFVPQMSRTVEIFKNARFPSILEKGKRSTQPVNQI